MKSLIFAILLTVLPAQGGAVPMRFEWDAVTQNTDGSPVGPVIYHLYKAKTPTGPFILLASRISTNFTWDVPELGEWYIEARSVNKLGESSGSNQIHVKVDPTWQQLP